MPACSWEDESVLLAFADEVARFRAQKPVAADAAERKKARAEKPSPANKGKGKGKERAETFPNADVERGQGQRKFTETPEWLVGGKLHAYQLEVRLPWCIYNRFHTVQYGI